MARMANFWKMDGTGNDFVIIDARKESFPTQNKEIILSLSSRDNRITHGCDQFIILEESNKADIFMRIFNFNGSEAEACGNATRCVAWLMFQESPLKKEISIETIAGILLCTHTGNKTIEVNMGNVKTEWESIPLSHRVDCLHLPLSCGELSDGVAVNIGNPHAVFFVNNASEINLKDCGPKLEQDSLFPEKANIEVAEIKNNIINLRVWERGVGETQACGTGACAAAVAAVERKKLDPGKISVNLTGGTLNITYKGNNTGVLMEGPINLQFEGKVELP